MRRRRRNSAQSLDRVTSTADAEMESSGAESRLWTAVHEGDEKTVRSLLKARAGNHWADKRDTNNPRSERTESIVEDATLIYADATDDNPTNHASVAPTDHLFMAESEVTKRPSSSATMATTVPPASDAASVAMTESPSDYATTAASELPSDATSSTAVTECLPCSENDPVQHSKNDLIAEAARQNLPGMIDALYECGVPITPLAFSEAAEHVDGAALRCLVRLDSSLNSGNSVNTSAAHNSLLLHSSLRLKEAFLPTPSYLHVRAWGDDAQWTEDSLLKAAEESFVQASKLACVQENKEHHTDSSNTIDIAGLRINEATDIAEYQRLVLTTLPSSSRKKVSAVHLHALLIMERLGDSRWKEYFSMICEQLWSKSFHSPSVEGGLACYGLFLHYISAEEFASELGDSSHATRPFNADHWLQCAKSIAFLLQWLLPKLSPGHCITVLPLFQWLYRLVTGPLKEKQNVLNIVGLVFRYLLVTAAARSEDEIRKAVWLFADLAEKEGVGKNLLIVVLQSEAKREYLVGGRCIGSLFTERIDKHGKEATSERERKHRWTLMVSTLLDLGMVFPALPADLLRRILPREYLSGVMEVLVSHGLDIWIEDSLGVAVGVQCSAQRL